MVQKTVLITGASRGLGKCLAIVFSKNKYNVIIHGRDEIALENVKKEILKNKVECEIVIGEITSKETLENLCKISKKRNLDVLINNAGIYLKKSVSEMTDEELESVLDINLISPIKLIKKIFLIFQEKKSGLIVNINSIAGKNGGDGESAYSASKFGLRGFSSSLRFDANRAGIRVIDFFSGAINTEMVSGRKDPEKCIQPEDAAEFIYKVCSQEYPSMRIDEVDISRRKY